MSKILSQGGYGCVYYPGINCQGHTNTNKTVVTKLQKKDSTAQNEIEIGRTLSDVPNFASFFTPITKSCDIGLSEIDNVILKKCNVIKSPNELNYILMELPYIRGSEFFEFITKLSSKREILFNLIETYQYLLNSLLLLLENGVIHFDLKSQNILYNMDTRLPLIIDFGISIQMNELSNQNLRNKFYTHAPSYSIWPIEVHIISYILHQSSSQIIISDIINNYMVDNDIFKIFSDNFKEDYKNAALQFFQHYVGMPNEKIIKDLLRFSKTWDNYALSVLYIKLLGDVFSKVFNDSKIIIAFSQFLLYNISFDPNKRLSIVETQNSFRRIFFLEEDSSAFFSLITQTDYNN